MGGMAEHTQLIDAINIRTAVRAYDDEPIDDDTARQLEMRFSRSTYSAISTFSWCATSPRCSPKPMLQVI